MAISIKNLGKVGEYVWYVPEAGGQREKLEEARAAGKPFEPVMVQLKNISGQDYQQLRLKALTRSLRERIQKGDPSALSEANNHVLEQLTGEVRNYDPDGAGPVTDGKGLVERGDAVLLAECQTALEDHQMLSDGVREPLPSLPG